MNLILTHILTQRNLTDMWHISAHNKKRNYHHFDHVTSNSTIYIKIFL